MKYLLFLYVFFTSLWLFGQNVNIEKGSELCSKGRIDKGIGNLNSKTLNLPGHSFDVLKYTIHCDLFKNFQNPYPKNFAANVTLHLKVDSILSSIVLNATESSIEIDSVGLAGQSFQYTNNLVNITLDQVYLPGNELEVTVYYKHKNVVDGAFNVSGGMVFTDCEPQGARKWFPCYDSPADKALTDISVRVPTNVKLGSNGRLQDSTIVNDTLIYHWVSADPVATYLVVLSGKVNYQLDVTYWHPPLHPEDSIPFRFYYNIGENPAAIKALLPEVCDFFSEIFCEHPFEKNGFATMNELFNWGGMENQTLTSLCANCWSEMLVVHEFAHQWFGDMITCGTWADIFLNEGFATYSEALWIEHQYGETDYAAAIQSDANAYYSGNPGTPISNPAWVVNPPSVNVLFNYAITYAKGSCVLHMLRYVMGDSLFFEGMKNYANHVDLKYKSAVIVDLIDVMNQTYGQSLQWFFDQWIYQPNHPVYYNEYSVQNSGNDFLFSFQMTQVQGGTYFKMPFELWLHFPDGSDTVLTGFNNENGQFFYWTLNQFPDSIVFDPENGILLKEYTLVVNSDELQVPVSGFSIGQASPNPVISGEFSLPVSLSFPGKIHVSISDVSGRIVSENFINFEIDSQIKYFTVNNLPSGCYFINFQNDFHKETRKIIVSQ